MAPAQFGAVAPLYTVHARTSSSPQVKKLIRFSSLKPVLMIFSRLFSAFLLDLLKSRGITLLLRLGQPLLQLDGVGDDGTTAVRVDPVEDFLQPLGLLGDVGLLAHVQQ